METTTAEKIQEKPKSLPLILEPPAILHLKLKDDATLSVSESDNEAQDQDGPYVPPAEDAQQKIVKQLEFYFSDENIMKDTFLLKHVEKDKNGYVSLKLLSSFRKVQKLTKNWKDLAFSLTHLNSPHLQLNDKQTKVKRTKSIPEWDPSTHERTIIVTNFEPSVQKNESKIEFLTSHFSNSTSDGAAVDKTPDVTLVRLVQPGKKVPKDMQAFLNGHPEMTNKSCALVEFRTVELAQKALKKFSGKDDWRGMQVFPLKKCPAVSKKSQKSGEKEKNPGGKKTLHKKIVQDSLSPAVTVTDSSGGSEAPSPRLVKKSSNREKDYRKNHVTSGSPSKQILGRVKSDAEKSRGRSPEVRDSPLSCSPASLENGGGNSPWILRRLQMRQDLSGSGEICKNRICVIRQPAGPDGTKGFTAKRI